MSRISMNLTGIERNLLNRLAEANAAAALSTLRMTTGARINSPSDDPTGFVMLSRFQNQLGLVQATLVNVNSASSLVTQAQTTVGSIRSQLETIRTELLKDEEGALTAEERAASQAVIDTALGKINEYAATAIDGRQVLDGSADFTVVGRNSSQVASLEIFSTSGNGPVQVASPASLTYTGSSRYVAAEATVVFTGNRGSTVLSVTADETLESLAERINAQTESTGIMASVTDNTLTLESETTGPNAVVDVLVSSGTFAVSGGDGQGRATGSSAQWATVPQIIGQVLEAATQAELIYTGAAGQITANASLAIAGKLGAANVSVTAGETLSTAAQRINAVSHETGVVAEVSGDELTLRSVYYGSSAEIGVTVSSGTFAVSGGHGDGSAQGTDAVAEINGHRIQGAQAAELRHREKTGTLADDATIQVTGHLGSTSITLNESDSLATAASAINAQAATTGVVARVDGNDLVLASTELGASSAIQIETTSGTFATVTGSSAATAARLAHSESTGALTGDAQIRLTGSSGSYDFSFTAGQTLAELASAINAQTGTTGVRAEATSTSLALLSVGTGESALVDVDLLSGSFSITGGDGTGHDVGENATAEASGADALTGIGRVDGNRLRVNQSGFQYILDLEAGFTGNLTPISVSGGALEFALSTDTARSSTLAIPGLLTAQFIGASGSLDAIATGGSASGLGTATSEALRIVEESLGRLTRIEGAVDGFQEASIGSASGLLDDLETDLQSAIDNLNGVDDEEEELRVAFYESLADNAISAISLLNQQRSSIVQMIRHLAGLE